MLAIDARPVSSTREPMKPESRPSSKLREMQNLRCLDEAYRFHYGNRAAHQIEQTINQSCSKER